MAASIRRLTPDLQLVLGCRLAIWCDRMCGILGGINCEPFDPAITQERLTPAVDCLAHRGPDDRSEYVSADCRAFLGHRRLSIIDLAGGHQPILNEAGRCRLCYNGEIYNF